MSTATGQLSADELAVCNATGIDATAFLAAKTEPVQSALTVDELAVCTAAGIGAEAFLASKNAPAAPALTPLERVVCDATGCDPAEFAAASRMLRGGNEGATPQAQVDGWWRGTRGYAER